MMQVFETKKNVLKSGNGYKYNTLYFKNSAGISRLPLNVQAKKCEEGLRIL